MSVAGFFPEQAVQLPDETKVGAMYISGAMQKKQGA